MNRDKGPRRDFFFFSSLIADVCSFTSRILIDKHRSLDRCSSNRGGSRGVGSSDIVIVIYETSVIFYFYFF